MGILAKLKSYKTLINSCNKRTENSSVYEFLLWKQCKQAGAELDQAQLKLGLGSTSTNLHKIELVELAIASYS